MDDRQLQIDVEKGFERGFSFIPRKGKIRLLPARQKKPRATLADVTKWLSQGRSIGLRTGDADGEAPGIIVLIWETHRDGLVPTGVTPRALQNWRHVGGGPSFIRVSARAVRYDVRDLDTWISSRRVHSTSEVTGS